MELVPGKEYLGEDERWWTFTGWISDRNNPGKKKACFSRIVKENKFVHEDELDEKFDFDIQRY